MSTRKTSTREVRSFTAARPFADTLEIGFYLYSRIGGLALNAGVTPLVSIKQAAA